MNTLIQLYFIDNRYKNHYENAFKSEIFQLSQL